MKKEPLKIVQFSGGLGNQLYQYAFYKALQKRFGNVKANISFYEHLPPNVTFHNGFELADVFNIKLEYSSAFENAIRGGGSGLVSKFYRQVCNALKLFYMEKNAWQFDPYFFNNKKTCYYYGYWQHKDYYKDIIEEVKNELVFKEPQDEQNLNAKSLIENAASVSIHVRRGDYVTGKGFGGICTDKYYKNAIKFMQNKVSNIRWFVFSDDIAWCRENINLPNCVYIGWNTGKNSYLDMYLMSLCKHNIIANSTFSWWGAMLNKNPEKIVVVPNKWCSTFECNVADIVPESWEQIEC